MVVYAVSGKKVNPSYFIFAVFPKQKHPLLTFFNVFTVLYANLSMVST